jgi:hypothetical protein
VSRRRRAGSSFALVSTCRSLVVLACVKRMMAFLQLRWDMCLGLGNVARISSSKALVWLLRRVLRLTSRCVPVDGGANKPLGGVGGLSFLLLMVSLLVAGAVVMVALVMVALVMVALVMVALDLAM